MTLLEEGSMQGSSWLGRSNYSRSICFGLNSRALSSTPGLILEDSILKDNTKPAGEDSQIASELIADGVLLSPTTVMLVNESLLESLSSEILQSPINESTSVETSPQQISCGHDHAIRRTLSLPSKGPGIHPNEDELSLHSSDEYGFDEIKVADECEMQAARTTSWSDFFVKSDNEVVARQPEDQMIDLSNLFLGPKFASGAHSRIYLGKYKECAVAVKILRMPDDDEKTSTYLDRQFNTEVNVLSQLNHRNIVKFVGACKKPPVCCIITEYLALGSVRSYLHNQPFPLTLKAAVDMALDIARGMEYLHSKGVIHRDLKSENLVIAEDMCVKITDFGVACFESKPAIMTDDVGTYRWMAPEMISKKHFSKKVDVYSFGIVLWELLTCRVPFEEYTPVQAAFAVVHKHARPALPLNCPSLLGHLLVQCWNADPEKRPNFTKVIGVLEEMQESIASNRNITLFNRHQRHAHGLLHCFGHFDPSQIV